MAELAACLVLAWVVVEDLRRFRIRNLAVGIITLAFVAACVEHGTTGLLLAHGAFAGLALALLALACFRGMIGGGDAKLLAAAFFWVGPEGALVFALILFVLTVATVVGANFRLIPTRRAARGTKIPFGPSIAGALATVIALSRAA